jgi:8-oxo-dGTP diphosphatase
VTTPSGTGRPVVAAGVLFVDSESRVLMVRPTYKEHWEIPGGFVEPGESPYRACVREVEEELGVRPPVGGLLSVDWAPDDGGDKLLFVFDGGRLDPPTLAAIRFGDGEIDRFAFVPAASLGDVTVERLARRIRESLRARSAGAAAYLEAGRPVPGR